MSLITEEIQQLQLKLNELEKHQLQIIDIQNLSH